MNGHGHDMATRPRYDGDGRNVAHLEIAIRDVDTDDLRTYARVDELRLVGEYVRAQVDVRYEIEGEWPN